MTMVYQHWRSERSESQIAYWVLDCADKKVNILNVEVLTELESLLDEVQADPPQGLIIKSGKTSGFCAGADVKEFTQLEGVRQAIEKLHYGQALFSRLESLPCPTVARIHGYCLGGGLELVLACDWRVAEDVPGCRLGLPEIRLGIHPGYGGSVRLPRLIGDMPALSMMLSGRIITARQARKLGLVDYAEPLRQLNTAAENLAVKLPERKQPRQNYWLTVPPLRAAAAVFLRKQVAKRVKERHYPAPYQLIDYWRHAPEERSACFEAEVQSVAKLFSTPTARNLVRAFLLRGHLKENGKGQATQFQHIHIVGAGVMGGDIAAWCALKGLRVTIQDENSEQLAAAVARADTLFKSQLKASHQITAACDRFIPDRRGLGVQCADLVIEAVSENLEIKRQVYADLEARMKPSAILATNTSSLLLEDLAQGLQGAKRFVGLHFFNPVAKMQLIEVVQAKGCDADVVSEAAAFVCAIGRLPLPVQSSPGFLVNRILLPYLLEAAAMVEEGIAPIVVDTAATDFGMPMGPIELADVVGLDICQSVAQTIAPITNFPIPDSLGERVIAGKLGKKTGEGYYRWKHGKPIKKQPSRIFKKSVSPDITDRLVMALLNEAVACFDEQIVASADLVDAGMIFGTGFAPFHGGPLHYLKTLGTSRAKVSLQRLASRYGERFAAHSGWER